MSRSEGPSTPKKLRLFTTLGDDPPKAAGAKRDTCSEGAGAPAQGAAAGGSGCGVHAFLSSRFDLPTTSLLFSCISGPQPGSRAELAGFDRQEGSAGSTHEQQGLLAAALATHLVPGWWALARGPFWRWQLQTLLESPCLGVPGICRYHGARDAWMSLRVQLCIEGDSCRQVVALRSGLSTLSHVLAQPGVKFFEVDSRSEVARKKAALDAVLPGWRRAACRPGFVEVDLLAGSMDLITHLTAAGFDPSTRCCVVAEGLLPYLSPQQGQGLLADLAALAAPGSRLLFDFLHSDALEASGSDLPGLPSLAAAVAAKGTPLRSGLKPAFSALVRHLQPHSFRLASLVPPLEVARLSVQPAGHAERAGPAAGKPGTAARVASTVSTGRLPYVPPFFSLVEAVKNDTRLLLRHAGVPPGDDQLSGAMLAQHAADATQSSPYCIIRSLAQLLGLGSGNHSAGSASSGGDGNTRAAELPAVQPAGRAGSFSSPDAAVPSQTPQRQPSSADWHITAAAAAVLACEAEQSAAAVDAPAAAGAAGAEQQGRGGPSLLHTAVSIGPLGLSASWAGHEHSSGSPVARGAVAEQQRQGGDTGHVLTSGGSHETGSSGMNQEGGEASQVEGSTSSWSLLSFLPAFFT